MVKIEHIDIHSVNTVVSVDLGYKGFKGVGVAVAYDFKNRREVCYIAVSSDIKVPYTPGLLAFREAPLMIIAIKELSKRCIEPDLIIVNGHGLAHPRRFGIASHIGVILDKPSIGVAKRLLYGYIIVDEKGREAIVVDGIKVGYALEYKRSKKIYVSVGHKITPEDAITIIEGLWNRKYPLPDPLYIADSLTKRLRSRL